MSVEKEMKIDDIINFSSNAIKQNKKIIKKQNKIIADKNITIGKLNNSLEDEREKNDFLSSNLIKYDNKVISLNDELNIYKNKINNDDNIYNKTIKEAVDFLTSECEEIIEDMEEYEREKIKKEIDEHKILTKGNSLKWYESWNFLSIK